MKKIIGLTIAAVLIIGMVGGGTWAYFSDTESTLDNTFTAGTLNLDLSDVGNSGNVTFTFEGIVPGDSDVLIWELNNTGSVGGYLNVEIYDVVNAENFDATTDEAEDEDDTNTSADGELGASLDIVLFWDDGTGTGATAGDGIQQGDEATIVADTLDNSAGSHTEDYSLGAGATTYISMTWEVDPDDVENEIMGDSVTFDMDIVLDQTMTGG